MPTGVYVRTEKHRAMISVGLMGRLVSAEARKNLSAASLGNQNPLTHGQSGSRTYRSWRAMIDRCTNPNRPGWKYYGSRGISVAPAWLGRDGFAQFLTDMGERPAGTSIDRYPDNEGDYEPKNCRWATRSEQRKNQRPRRRN